MTVVVGQPVVRVVRLGPTCSSHNWYSCRATARALWHSYYSAAQVVNLRATLSMGALLSCSEPSHGSQSQGSSPDVAPATTSSAAPNVSENANGAKQPTSQRREVASSSNTEMLPAADAEPSDEELGEEVREEDLLSSSDISLEKREALTRFQRLRQTPNMCSPEEALADIHLTSLIGSGGFASVFSGLWHGSGHVAVKICCTRPKQDGQFPARVLMEAIICKGLAHPSIIQTCPPVQPSQTGLTPLQPDSAWQAGSKSNSVKSVDEFGALVDTQTLPPVSWAEILDLMHAEAGQMLTILIMHRAKLGNLWQAIQRNLFEPRPELPAVDRRKRTRALLRTACEIAGGLEYLHMNDIIHADLHMSKASDVYAFGILVLEMARSGPAYSKACLADLADRVISEDLRPEWPAHVCPELGKLYQQQPLMPHRPGLSCCPCCWSGNKEAVRLPRGSWLQLPRARLVCSTGPVHSVSRPSAPDLVLL
ncbi:protein kinase domain-containing protein [Haematococcus lacustris]|uniref:Protein kinase domain-containing protein n=1 Tax=Haematococcus lacustris TaxID=44745 RepID=A0A699ZXT8_HAELA|nr:protein kinase domain-containing protein [Haematococcus lacustris]